MICKHSFFKISEVTKLPGDHVPGTAARALPGIEAGCINCGQVRRVFVDGTVEVKVEGGKPIDEDVNAR